MPNGSVNAILAHEIPATDRTAREHHQLIDRGLVGLFKRHAIETKAEFDIPSNAIVHRHGQIATHRIVWIHPAHNAEHCHHFNDVPGDLPNFYVEVEEWDGHGQRA
jgi:hypothetical protein